MKDGTTHLAYKAEHVVDLDTEFILSARVTPADHGDAETMVDSVAQAQMNLDGLFWPAYFAIQLILACGRLSQAAWRTKNAIGHLVCAALTRVALQAK
jgi:hypothetical protein